LLQMLLLLSVGKKIIIVMQKQPIIITIEQVKNRKGKTSPKS
jgi:hypothetical protein